MEKDVTYLIQKLRKETTKEGNKLLDELIDMLLLFLKDMDDILKLKHD